MNISELWWTRISNTQRFINDVLDALYMGKSVVISFPSEIPWKDTLRQQFEMLLEKSNYDKTFDAHTVSDVKYPGEFIFEKYCNPREKNSYWTTISYERFMAQNKSTVLNSKFVYLDGIKPSKVIDWLKSISEYLQYFNNDTEHGIFIMLTEGTVPYVPKYIVKFNYSEYVSDYDCLMLCLTIVSKLECSGKEKQYIAEVANTIADGNYEVAGYLAEYGYELIENPFKTVQEVFHKHKISYTDLSKRVNSALWEAQIKIVFPIVEAYRKYFIEKYNSQLNEYLPFKVPNASQRIANVYDLEIGHLYFINEKYRIANKDDHDLLVKIREARNEVSHWNVIELQKLRNLL